MRAIDNLPTSMLIFAKKLYQLEGHHNQKTAAHSNHMNTIRPNTGFELEKHLEYLTRGIWLKIKRK